MKGVLICIKAHKMSDITCVMCCEGNKPLCDECKHEDFYRFHVCAGCASPCAENDCGGYFLCNCCAQELDDFWAEEDSDDETDEECE